MNIKAPLSSIVVATTLLLSSIATPVHAIDSVGKLSEGVSNAVGGSLQIVGGSVMVVSAVVAVPLLAVGSVAGAANHAGTEMMDWAVGEPLPIADETISAGPAPSDALADKGL